MLDQLANTLAAFRSGILAYYDFDRLSTGPLEGANNKNIHPGDGVATSDTHIRASSSNR